MIFILFVAIVFFRHQIKQTIAPLSRYFSETEAEAHIITRYIASVFVGVTLVAAASLIFNDLLAYIGITLIIWSLWTAMADTVEMHWTQGKQHKVDEFRQTLPHNR